MRKLDLRDYEVTQRVRVNTKNGSEVQVITGPYHVKDSILNIMFLPALQLKGAEMVKQNVLAIKIEQAGDEVMLEDAEYERVKRAAELYPCERRADVEFIDRILNQTPEINEGG